MPRMEFAGLPGTARVWAFGSTRQLNADEESGLLRAVDEFLDEWRAHGLPLSCARDWREGRFLAVAVDQRDAHASGCSIDGLYRVLRELERELATGLLGGGVVYFRDGTGGIKATTRHEFTAAAERGEITPDTPVFDLTVQTVDEWLRGLEKPVASSWHGTLRTADC